MNLKPCPRCNSTNTTLIKSGYSGLSAYWPRCRSCNYILKTSRRAVVTAASIWNQKWEALELAVLRKEVEELKKENSVFRQIINGTTE